MLFYGVYAIEDASGRQEFSYGRMGEVIRNIRTFVLPNELNTYTFKMEFRYDSWNRILTTCYPDGEKVSYNYNKGGQLKNMNSNYNGQTYNYINSINYNKFEKRTLIIYGNGARAEYSYDILQRLTRLRSISNSGIMQDIEYKFDNVNNIRFIRNMANTLSNGLGGTYSHEYSYDNMYRLKNSDGNWQGLTYQLNMTYSDDGRILSKNQTGTTLLYGQLSYFSYQNNYTYNVFKHTLDNITDTNDVQNFEYDANGNLIHHEINTQNLTNDRTLCWDEENRLMSVIDNNFTSYYVYDNANERTFKLTGTNSLMNINGNWMNYALLTNPTLYTSAYLVANNQGYSKHYYAGSERIATSIGKGGLEGISTPLVLKTFHGYWKDKATALNKVMDRTLRGCGGIQYSCKGDLSHLYDLEHNSPNPMELYFYHSDHLGSSSWITDRNGQAIQHLHYLPYGEDWIAQRNTSWTTPYTFSGKEKDAETGYGYFGARYYDTGLSIWLSVDPMSDKYPSMSPYNYCANNPIILVDPDGRELEPIVGLDGELLGCTKEGWKGIPIVMDKKDYKDGMSKDQALEKGTSLDEYGKGIKISDKTLEEIENKGGEKMDPSVENNSKSNVYYKPETTVGDFDNAEAYEIKPGEQLYMPVDGVATSKFKRQVCKIPTGTSVSIKNDGGVSFKGKVGPLARLTPMYGWITRNKISAKDHSWDKLFNKAYQIGKTN